MVVVVTSEPVSQKSPQEIFLLWHGGAKSNDGGGITATTAKLQRENGRKKGNRMSISNGNCVSEVNRQRAQWEGRMRVRPERRTS